MKKPLLVLVSAGLVLAKASATTLVYEGFNYTVPSLVFGQVNGNGQTWLRAGVANPPDSITNTSLSLAVPPELAPTTGNSAQISGIGNGSGSSLRLGLGSTVTSGTVYFSFALQITALTGANNTSGGFFTGLNNSTGTQASNPGVVGAKISARIDPGDATKYQLGIFNNITPTGSATTWISPSLTVGDTHFIVAAYTFNPGAGDDVSSIWINPGSLGAAGPVPTPTMTATGGTDLAQVASILLRQSPAPYLKLDELRVGTDWASVVPEPAAASLMGISMLIVVGWHRFRKR